jgi:hypothetical protein
MDLHGAPRAWKERPRKAPRRRACAAVIRMMKVKGTSLDFCGDFQSRDDVEGDGSEGRSGWVF